MFFVILCEIIKLTCIQIFLDLFTLSPSGLNAPELSGPLRPLQPRVLGSDWVSGEGE